ncbi:MAG: hypothetical protein KAV00_15500, partial [Phycisphaerae bacterium]|nr:hypothetical protein [Phycisphaerae bacterium]
MTVLDGEIIKFAAEWDFPDGVIAQNVFYWRADITSPASDPVILAAAADLVDDVFIDLVSEMCDDIVPRLSTCSRIAFDEGTGTWLTNRILGYETLTVSPVSTDDPMPNVVAASMVARTARPKTRARKQIGGLGETSFLDNDLTAGALADFVNAAASWLDPAPVDVVGFL